MLGEADDLQHHRDPPLPVRRAGAGDPQRAGATAARVKAPFIDVL